MSPQSPREEEGEREENERNVGCFLEGLFWVGEGCLWTAVPCLAGLIWVVSR